MKQPLKYPTVGHLNLIFTAFAALLLVGCASVPPPAQVETAREFAVPLDKLWPALISELGLNYPVRVVEKDSGLLTTEPVIVANWYKPMGWHATLPNVLLPTWSTMRMSINVVVTDAGEGRPA